MEALSFTAGAFEEECALTCSVLEEDAALAQVRRAAPPCSCEEVYALREGLCREAEGLSFAAGTLEEE